MESLLPNRRSHRLSSGDLEWDEPDLRLREAAERIGITERAVQRIVTDLEDAGVITRTREGRRNTYAIDEEARLRHPSDAHMTVGELLKVLSL